MTVICFICAALPGGWYVYGAPGQTDLSGDETHQSSFAYKRCSTNDMYKMALKSKMRSVHTAIASSINDSLTLPIPGLVKTLTTQNGSENASQDFVPQGICKAGKYWLVTAYDAKKLNNTVIYVVDTTQKKLVSTITLPNTYHAGGIAFDGSNIWLTGDTSDKYKGNPFVQYITFETFKNMIKEPLHEVKRDEISEHVYIKNKPSFLECDNGVLWVGTYIGRKNTAEGYMNGYPITDQPGRNKLNTNFYSVITGIDASSQGADIEGNYLYVSSSFKGTSSGVKSSFVTKYEIGPLKNGKAVLMVSEREITRIEVPKMNEEIIVDGSNIYINFESASETWKRAVINTDRILAVKRSLWG